MSENNLDQITNFLQASGWSFGWYRVEEDGVETWQVDASKGKKSFITRHEDLPQALHQIKHMVVSLN